MKKKKKVPLRRKQVKPTVIGGASIALTNQWGQIRQKMEESSEDVSKLWERLQDAEIHINLLTRLITTLCIEKLGMRVGVLKRLLKRIEKEAIQDCQILHLESIYNLHPQNKKSSLSSKPPKKDPWDEIS